MNKQKATIWKLRNVFLKTVQGQMLLGKKVRTMPDFFQRKNSLSKMFLLVT